MKLDKDDMKAMIAIVADVFTFIFSIALFSYTLIMVMYLPSHPLSEREFLEKTLIIWGFFSIVSGVISLVLVISYVSFKRTQQKMNQRMQAMMEKWEMERFKKNAFKKLKDEEDK